MSDSLVITASITICHKCHIVDVCLPLGLDHEGICINCADSDPTLTEIRLKEYINQPRSRYRTIDDFDDDRF